MQLYTPYESYRHAAETINPTGQIFMLYSSAISYVKQAKIAIEQKDFDSRYRLMDKAMSIMHGLRACLSSCPSEEIAQAMDRYYLAIDNLMIAVQCNDDTNICDAIVTNLETIKGTWAEINHYSAVFTISDEEPEEEHQNMII